MVVLVISVRKDCCVANEKTLSWHGCLAGVSIQARWYQHLSYVNVAMLPVREVLAKLAISLA